MRVTHVITRLIVGGAQENTLYSVLGLREKPGLQVDLISGPTTGPEGSLEPRARACPGLLTVTPDLMRPIRPRSDVRAFRHLTRLLRSWRSDIVHTHSAKGGILGRLAAKRAGVPIVVHTIHGPSFGTFQGPLANLLYRTAERYAGRFTTHFVSVADAMTQQYLSAGIGTPGQYTRILSGFDVHAFVEAARSRDERKQFRFSDGDIVIGKIARLSPLKGHEDLFAIAPELVRRCPEAKFLLIGDGPLRNHFEEQARAAGLADRFRFAGLMRPDEVPACVAAMDLVIHLSHREGLPRALPQALAAAKAVVAYDCDGAREVCLDRKTGFLVPPGDRPTLLERILTLAQDRELRDRLGACGRQFVTERFTTERMVDDLHTLYERLAARHAAADRAAEG